MSLKDKTILITRRPEQAQEMIGEIQRLGGVALLAPMIEIVAPESWEAADRAIGMLDRFDALVIASANAAEHFFGRCGDAIRQHGPLAVYAVGDRTRAAIERFGVRSEALPEEFSAAGLAAALDPPEIRGKRILIPRGDRSGDDLPRLLTAMGADVETVIVYRTIRPQEPDGVALRGRIRAGEIDVVTFASPSAVANFADLLAPADLSLLCSRAAVAVIGPTTAESARRAGFSVAIVAQESTGAGLVRAIADYFQ